MEKLSYKLPVFEGPLDLLLHLIAKNKLNIYDIQVSVLLEQYMEHIHAMQESDMDVASEFLEMAARLVYLKTVMLLPRQEEAEKLREELTGELLEYRVCQEMAGKLGRRTGGFGHFVREPMIIEADKRYRRTHDKDVLVTAYLAAVGRGRRRLPPPIQNFTQLVARKVVSVSSKVVFVLRRLWSGRAIQFRSLFEQSDSRSDLVATFLAVLELIKARRVQVSGEQSGMMVQVFKEDKAHGDQ